MSISFLVAITGGIPIFSAIFQIVSDTDIAERHHSHHDTYRASKTFTRMLVYAMGCMGGAGILVCLLQRLGLLDVDIPVAITFFCSFVVTTWAVWAMFGRYRVETYSDYLRVVPLLGRARVIPYDRICDIRTLGDPLWEGNPSVCVYERGRRTPALLWNLLDVEQILMRINRPDLLERG
jgi:hypothetical protein